MGSHVVARLMLMGSQVRVLDNFSTGRIDNLADAASGGLTEADVISGDVRTPEGVEVIHQWQPDVVVHLAAQPSVPAAHRSPLYDADVNVFGTVNVLDACVRSGVRLVVNAASSAVYGNVPTSELPVREDHPIAPVSPYGISTAAGCTISTGTDVSTACRTPRWCSATSTGPGRRAATAAWCP
ncbi:GDP-mannose 4,6-dehydratase [Micromonospora sp. M12]